MFDRRLAAADAWSVIAAQLQRSESRDAAWRAVHARFGELIGALPGDRLTDVIGATAALCTPGARAELVGDLAALPARSVRALARSLATIDRCIARRAAIGDLAAALTRPGQQP